MELQQLQRAVEIARCGSITQAARNLYIAQPNLSRSLRELEDELGIVIFARTTRGIIPTEAGRQFLQEAEEILQRTHALKESTRLSASGYLRLRFTASPYLDCIQPLAQRLEDKRENDAEKNPPPVWEISFAQMASMPALERLIAGEDDLAFLCYPTAYERFFQQLFTQNQLSSQLLKRMPMQVVLNRRHPLAEQKEIQGNQLAGYPRIMLDGSLPELSPRQRRDQPELLPAEQRLKFSHQQDALAMLSHLHSGYLWHPPLAAEQLEAYGLRQLPCPQGGSCQVMAVTAGERMVSPAVSRFIRWISESLAGLD